MSTIIFGLVCFLIGAAVMFFAYRNNARKFTNIADSIKNGKNPEDIIKDIKKILEK